MKYVMSDLHGMYEKYIAMLEQINFTEDDELFIIGDVMDRGDSSLKIIDHIVANKNIHLIRGNHEQMYLDFDEQNDNLWFYNGGNKTFSEIMNRGFDYKEQLYKYIVKTPHYMVLDNFILVHAGLIIPNENSTLEDILGFNGKDTYLWGRSHIDNEKIHKKYKIICGHTPTIGFNEIKYKDRLGKIINNGSYYYIDCGCCFEKHGGKLACLRLDDMEEFYI